MFDVKNVFYFMLISCLPVNCVSRINKPFERSSILYGIAAIAKVQVQNDFPHSLCFKELAELYKAVELERVWAYKMLDVSGQPSTGFLWGNNGWMGQSTVCCDLTNREPLEVYHAKIHQLITDYDYSPYDTGFATAYMRHDSQLQMKTNTPNENSINLGLCVPLSCTGNEMQTLLQQFFKKKILTFQKLYDINFKIEHIKTVDPTSAWLTKNPINIAILLIITGIFLFVLAASHYHSYVFRENFRKTNSNSTEANDNEITQSHDPVKKIKEVVNKYERFILCFSWYNTNKLIATSEVPDKIGAINGMMFFTMIGIAVYNFLIYGASYSRSLGMDFRKYEGFWWQIVVNSSFSIDTYLFLSGCLISYKFYTMKYDILPDSAVISTIHKLYKLFTAKLLKSIPVYTMWILWSIYIFSYLDARWSTYLPEKPNETCPKTWWKNLLFINNLQSLQSSENCLSWTWLIAAEMQFFVFNIFILFISTFSLFLSVVLSMITIFFSVYSTQNLARKMGYIHTLDQQLAQIVPIYQLPLCRIGPYIVGILTGILIFKLDGKLPFKRKIIWFGWTVAPLINIYLIFCTYGSKPSPEFSSLYISVGRTVWAIGLAWILLACSTENAGFINNILSYEGFKIFHRLSFSSYILMVLSIIFTCVTFETTISMSTVSYICQVLSCALFPYLINIFFSMFYEIPFELIWKVFFE